MTKALEKVTNFKLPTKAWSRKDGIEYIKQSNSVSFQVRYKAYSDARKAHPKGHKWSDAEWAAEAELDAGYVSVMSQGFALKVGYTQVSTYISLKDQILKAKDKAAPKPATTKATVDGRDAEADVLPPEGNNVVPLYAPKVSGSGNVEVVPLTNNQMAVTLMASCHHEITAEDMVSELFADFGKFPTKMEEFAAKFEEKSEVLREAARLIRERK